MKRYMRQWRFWVSCALSPAVTIALFTFWGVNPVTLVLSLSFSWFVGRAFARWMVTLQAWADLRKAEADVSLLRGALAKESRELQEEMAPRLHRLEVSARALRAALESSRKF